MLITCSYWLYTDIEYYPLIWQIYTLHHKVSRKVRHFIRKSLILCFAYFSYNLHPKSFDPFFEDFVRGTIIFLYCFLTVTWYIIKRYVKKKWISWKIIAFPFCNYKGHYLRMCNRVRGQKMNNFTFDACQVLSNV